MMQLTSGITQLVSLLGLSSTASALAFPGAVGFGAIATGGTGGTTVHVTNLNDSGAGSFRDAVSKSNRIVVFDVSGYIRLQSAVSMSSSITIQGQTAPGSGIGLMGAELSASKKSNIIIQHLRMRQGTLDSSSGKSAINIGESSNVILDHCSFTYGQWNSIDAVKAVNLTVSNSIIAFPIGQQFGAHVEGGPSTFYANLWVSAHNRQPLSKDNTQFVNNVIYNYQLGYTAGNTGGKFSHDIINNYFITGPSTSVVKDLYFQMNAGQTVYARGNFLDSNNDGTLNGGENNAVDKATIVGSPWNSASQSLATRSAADAYSYVLANAGAQPRDEVDQFAATTVRSLGKQGTIYKSEVDTHLSNGGYGTLKG